MVNQKGSEMEDLSHWDGDEDFSAGEAAALIAGVDPHNPNTSQYRVEKILTRIGEGYEMARKFVAGHPMTPEEFRIWRASRLFAHALSSVRVECYPVNQKAPWPTDPDRNWDHPKQFRGEYGDFEQQRFARAELIRWLGEIKLPSKYQFQRPQVAGPAPIIKSPSLAVAEAKNEVNTLDQQPSQTRTANAGPKFGMRRGALVERYKKEWPTIETDLQNASKNGLSNAKFGSRDWDEDVALEWALKRGKRTCGVQGATLPVVEAAHAFYASSRKHKLQG